MEKIDIAKKTLGFAASLGAGKIVHEIVKNNVVTTTPLERVSVAAGSFALGGAVAEVAQNHMKRTIDEVVEAVHTIRNAKTA